MFRPGRIGSRCARDAPLAIAIAVNALYFRITIVIMSLVSTATQTGYFATSYRIIEVLLLLGGSGRS